MRGAAAAPVLARTETLDVPRDPTHLCTAAAAQARLGRILRPITARVISYSRAPHPWALTEQARSSREAEPRRLVSPMPIIGNDYMRNGSAQLADAEPFAAFVGRSAAIHRVRTDLRAASRGARDVLVVGETGTGKDIAARGLHRAWASTGDFVCVNCAALRPELAASELFGHKRGAFTGAEDARPGAFREGDRGTVFLDELNSLEGNRQETREFAARHGIPERFIRSILRSEEDEGFGPAHILDRIGIYAVPMRLIIDSNNIVRDMRIAHQFPDAEGLKELCDNGPGEQQALRTVVEGVPHGGASS